MKKKIVSRKLHLSKKTIALLNNKANAAIDGGSYQTTATCRECNPQSTVRTCNNMPTLLCPTVNGCD